MTAPQMVAYRCPRCGQGIRVRRKVAAPTCNSRRHRDSIVMVAVQLEEEAS